MLINPTYAIQQGWILFPEWMTTEQREKCIQPNALDITADKISWIASQEGTAAHLSETSKSFHSLEECSPDEEGFVTLYPLKSYDIMSDFYVNIPTGVAAELTIRSTLNRAGLALNSGIWDSGFKGNLGAVIFNRAGKFKLALHTRVCQIKFIKSDSEGMYSGGYNTQPGQHWTESTK